MHGRIERKADRVARALLEQIVSGDLDVGSVIPKEAELAASFGVNRSVVREAVKLLEVHRLVRPVRRKGTVVLNPQASLSPEVLRAMLMPGPGRVDRSVLADVLEVRAALDVQMSRLAAERRTEADVVEMRRVLGVLSTSLDQPPRFAETVNELAIVMARATQNRIFEMLVHWHTMVYRDLEDLFSTVRLAQPPYVQGLSFLIQLIEDQEADKVGALVAKYHEWATPRILAAAALRSGEPLDAVVEEMQ